VDTEASLIHNLADLVDQYNKVNNEFRRFTLGKKDFIGMNGALRAIHYMLGHEVGVAKGMQKAAPPGNPQVMRLGAILEYLSALDDAVTMLADICYKQYVSGLGDCSYSNKQYMQDLDSYKALVKRHEALGERMKTVVLRNR